MIWLILGTIWIICGFVGGAIAENKNASVGLGFTLGLLFGPIGLIVAALLSPAENAATLPRPADKLPHPPAEANLLNAQYKLWLIETYGIIKSEILGEFVCGEKSFKSIDDALEFAHVEETEKRDREEKESERREAEWEAEREKLLADRAEQDAKDIRILKQIGISIAVVLLVASPFLYSFLKEVEQLKEAKDAAIESRAADILADLGLEMSQMGDFTARIVNSEYSCDGKRGVQYQFDTSEEVRDQVRAMISSSGRETSYSRNEGYVRDYVVDANPYFSGYFTVCEVGAEMPDGQ